MICPKCKDIILAPKSPGSPPSCLKCKGIWLQLDKGEEVLKHHEILSHDSFDEKNHHDSKTGLCPEGHGIMVRAKVPAEKPYYLERCMTCGGIWFDRGELKTLIENDLPDYLAEFWTTPWRRKQQRKLGTKTYLQINEELLGTDIYQQTLALAHKVKDHPEKSRVLDLLRYELFS